MLITVICYADEGHPKHLLRIQVDKEILGLYNDTVPDIKKMPDAKTDSVVHASAIKEVPKAKKQAAPVSVSSALNIKPIKVIKPRIIKPVIKIN